MKRSDWADIAIKIDGKPFDWDSYPWVIEPMDSTARRIVVKKGSQIGFSVLITVRALYDVLEAGRNAMIVEPTKEDIKTFQSRVIEIIDDIPESIRGEFHAREGEIHFKDKGTTLYLRSSGGRTSLRSVPVQSIYVDEVSAIKALKLSQALSRIDAAKDKFAMFVSTPDYPGKGISAMHLDGDCRQWRVQCHQCGEFKALDWEDFQLYDDAPERSFLRCPSCQTPRLPDKSKWVCKWVATVKAGEGYESYHVSQLASHTVTYRELAEKAVQAQRHSELLRNFTNEVLGLDWLPTDATRLQLFHVRKCQRPYGNATQIPRDHSTCHIMGIDQGRVNTFGIARVDFPLGSNRHPLDAAFMQVVAVGQCPESDFDEIRTLQRDFGVWATVVDHAGSSARLAEEWARNSRTPSWLCRYVESNEVVEFMESEKASFPLLLCNRTWAISSAQRRLKLGKIALPNDVEEHWLAQLTNAALDNTGKRYLKIGPDHLCHAFSYMELALHLVVKHFSGDIRWTRRTA